MKSTWDLLFVFGFLLIIIVPVSIIMLMSKIITLSYKILKRPKFKVGQGVQIQRYELYRNS